jgi:hypothetical protein
MDKRFGYFILLGLLIGMLFGSANGSANGNALLGLGAGALAGMSLGWFIAAAAIEIENDKRTHRTSTPPMSTSASLDRMDTGPRSSMGRATTPGATAVYGRTI